MPQFLPRASLAAASALALALGSLAGAAPTAPEPILDSPQQVEAEKVLLALLDHPDVKAIQAGLRAELARIDIGQTPDGAATIDRAIGCLTNSLIFKEMVTYRAKTEILWTTEDSPRAWHGHVVGCTGTAGDNPDNIYRGAFLRGGERYEVTGSVDLKRRASQLIFQIGPGEPGFAPKLAGTRPEAVETLAVFDDRELQIGPDGSFRVTIGGESGGGASGAAKHIVTPPGPFSIGFRDSLSDWNQLPARIAIRKLDGGEPRPYDPDELRRRVVGRLGDYVRNWADFPHHWFGGLKPNSYGGPQGREGGWGFVAGLRFALAPDEALAVTISRGGAGYTGFQVVDPWTLAADARNNLTSLNLAQAAPDRDGNFTYVIARSDPGVANWLDTTGLNSGFAVIRWQATPATATRDGLIRSFKVIKLADAAKLPGIARTTPKKRQTQLARRAREWALRLR